MNTHRLIQVDELTVRCCDLQAGVDGLGNWCRGAAVQWDRMIAHPSPMWQPLSDLAEYTIQGGHPDYPMHLIVNVQRVGLVERIQVTSAGGSHLTDLPFIVARTELLLAPAPHVTEPTSFEVFGRYGSITGQLNIRYYDRDGQERPQHGPDGGFGWIRVDGE